MAEYLKLSEKESKHYSYRDPEPEFPRLNDCELILVFFASNLNSVNSCYNGQVNNSVISFPLNMIDTYEALTC